MCNPVLFYAGRFHMARLVLTKATSGLEKDDCVLNIE